MANIDYTVTSAVANIMENILEACPTIFPGFDVNLIGCVHTKGKERKRKPIALKAVKYPYNVWMDKVYIVEVADGTWSEMSEKQRNLAVFHIMCAIPEGAFDADSKDYAKIKRPDYEMYAEEFAACGGVPNWMENDAASDPIEQAEKGKEEQEPKKAKTSKKSPVTAEGIASVGMSA